MKKFTRLLVLIILLLPSLTISRVLAQTNQLPDQPCNYITPDGCSAVGYVSVTPRPEQPGGPQNEQLDVELFFQDICENVTEITINQVQGPPVTLTDADITATLQTIVFAVNANSFKDGKLKVTITYADGSKEMVDIVFDESFNCGIIEPLPVELTSFEGKATESGINLEWETASELNNSHFDVERSPDGNHFSSIGTVQGSGTTSLPASYKLTDKDPLKGINYYRLKQVDYDNAFSYSKTIAVHWETGDAMQVMLLPNPCRNGDCTITLSNVANTETLVQLKDMAGRVVYSKTVKGDSHALELPLNELKQYRGLYFLSATAGNKVVYQRIVLE
ncbi:T9SS type A sorting domain-containing protein [Pontibacter sp. KCTC 32443]|uniref:T9SS type A sorting domain-containing protein n=1 Tax=Pontibacter TaxID=323449 RepID=UPI00164DC553|nr:MULTISPECIES: T9SS type A sorting domain-containing protein [Pontibacter]MBC5775902.1 T9SS type A sorting domain-containing protein [Pontibacter sp. KCTC 32443]